MTSTKALASLSMEVFVEQVKVLPMWVFAIAIIVTQTRTIPCIIYNKQRYQTITENGGGILKIEPGAIWTSDFKSITVEVVITF